LYLEPEHHVMQGHEARLKPRRRMPRKAVGDQELPESLNNLLHHLQDHIERAPTDRHVARLVRFIRCLSPRITEDDNPEILGIDLNVARSLCAEGVPDEVFALRAALWKVVLGYLPTDAFAWDASLSRSRELYRGFAQDLLEADLEQVQDGLDLLDTLDQIKKDVVRTRPDMDFFGKTLEADSTAATVSPMGSWTVAKDPDDLDALQPRCHHDCVARILLLYARFNPGVRYVQGMNELCAPLYYLFATDPLQGDEAEADAFFCFSAVMADMRDSFVKTLDHTKGGMFGQISQMNILLQEKDAEVWSHLEKHQVSPVYYSVRWLTLMLTQELDMPDVLRLWDSLLSDFARPHPFLHYICVAMIIRIREVLLAGDFTDCLKILQRYPPLPLDETLQLALRLRAADLVPAGFSGNDLPVVGEEFADSRKESFGLRVFRLADFWREGAR